MKKEHVLIELLAGILLWGVMIQLICIIAFENDLYNAVGLWTGIAVAVFMAIHIKRSIEDTLDIGVEDAEKYARNAYAKRTIITLAIIAVVVIFNLGNPITLVVGIFPLKLSAYAQPYMHKVFVWFEERRHKH